MNGSGDGENRTPIDFRGGESIPWYIFSPVMIGPVSAFGENE
jgi:hypothetical protein